jgi:DNA (cytosine-5)-methyltransferase 1
MERKCFIEVFSGAGGLSEGFIRAGFECISHVEMNKDACSTLETRAIYHYLKKRKRLEEYRLYLLGFITRQDFIKNSGIPNEVLNSVINAEISDKSIDSIFKSIDDRLLGRVPDLIIGGPPCQAYSIVGRSRDPNKMKEDPRNHLYLYYIEFLKKYQPKVFVFENVPGILSANNGTQLGKIFDSIKAVGYNVEYKVLNAKDFNVLQDRKRVIIIGSRSDIQFEYPQFKELDLSKKKRGFADLTKDLKFLRQGQGIMGAVGYASEIYSDYLKEAKIRTEEDEFVTHHIARPHNENDLNIYRLAVDLKSKGRNLNYRDDLPQSLKKHKNQSSFLNRFNVVAEDDLSRTVVAHISSDGHYFIHPDINQNRSISVREAARIQSFPDNYFFEGSRTSAFKQIGNAVPPLMAEGIAKQILKKLNNEEV